MNHFTKISKNLDDVDVLTIDMYQGLHLIGKHIKCFIEFDVSCKQSITKLIMVLFKDSECRDNLLWIGWE